jgi:hypothetical protein
MHIVRQFHADEVYQIALYLQHAFISPSFRRIGSIGSPFVWFAIKQILPEEKPLYPINPLFPPRKQITLLHLRMFNNETV